MQLLLEATHTFRYAGSILSIAVRLELLYLPGHFHLFNGQIHPVVEPKNHVHVYSYFAGAENCLHSAVLVILAENPCWSRKLGGVSIYQSQTSRDRRRPDMLCPLKLNMCKREKEPIGN